MPLREKGLHAALCPAARHTTSAARARMRRPIGLIRPSSVSYPSSASSIDSPTATSNSNRSSQRLIAISPNRGLGRLRRGAPHSCARVTMRLFALDGCESKWGSLRTTSMSEMGVRCDKAAPHISGCKSQEPPARLQISRPSWPVPHARSQP